MKTYQDVKKEAEEKRSQLIESTGMFFAFSDEQFAKNKTPLEEDDTYVSAGMGAYLPKSKVSIWKEGMAEIDKNRSSQIKDNNLEKQEILYELYNHEAFYTGDVEDTYFALGKRYTTEQIWEVYHENSKDDY